MGGEERDAGTKILVVDDDEASRAVIMRMLEGRGHTTLAASSAEAAEEMLEEEEVHLIVADLRMPGMSGVELVRRARARHPQVAAIYVSGHPGDLALSPEGDAGAAAVLEKPFGREQLLGAVDDALAGG